MCYGFVSWEVFYQPLASQICETGNKRGLSAPWLPVIAASPQDTFSWPPWSVFSNFPLDGRGHLKPSLPGSKLHFIYEHCVRSLPALCVHPRFQTGSRGCWETLFGFVRAFERLRGEENYSFIMRFAKWSLRSCDITHRPAKLRGNGASWQTSRQRLIARGWCGPLSEMVP